MFWYCLLILSCAAVSLGEEYRSYYVPETHYSQVREHYNDGANYGQQGLHDYDHGGHKHLENIHDAHGSRDYEEGENHALRDSDHQSHHNHGAHEAVHSSGGQQNHVRKAHDRGFYEREKKYGYEKAYGYERETNQHDKANNAASHGSGYNHNQNRGHHNQGAQSFRDHASHGNRHNHGSEAHGNKKILIDLSANHNRGRDYNNQHSQYPPVLPYKPHLKSEYNGIDNSLERFRYMSGIHGLGGIRGYGKGYLPLRYGYSPVPRNAHTNPELVYVRHIQPHSNTYYSRYEE